MSKVLVFCYKCDFIDYGSTHPCCSYSKNLKHDEFDTYLSNIQRNKLNENNNCGFYQKRKWWRGMGLLVSGMTCGRREC